MLVLNLRAFKNKKYTAYDRFHRNSLYGEIPTKKDQSERSDLPCYIIMVYKHKVIWCDNYGFLTSLYPTIYLTLNTVSWPLMGVLYDLFEFKLSYWTW